jgi:hypothetical protein
MGDGSEPDAEHPQAMDQPPTRSPITPTGWNVVPNRVEFTTCVCANT